MYIALEILNNMLAKKTHVYSLKCFFLLLIFLFYNKKNVFFYILCNFHVIQGLQRAQATHWAVAAHNSLLTVFRECLECFENLDVFGVLA